MRAHTPMAIVVANQAGGGFEPFRLQQGATVLVEAYLADARRPWSDGAVQIDLGPLGVNCYYSRQ